MLWWEPIARLLAAAALGALPGLEREARGKPAGLKTFVLVAAGACAFMPITLRLPHTAEVDTQGADIVRAISGVITGIGFLGGGAIIQSRGDVSGITTAAGIWVTGGIGLACGAGFYDLGAYLAALMLLTLTVLSRVEDRWLKPKK